MNELQKPNGQTTLTSDEVILNAHKYLQEFLNKFDHAKRGGVHDFIEITLYNMLNMAIGNIDTYLRSGHKEVNANEIMAIAADAFQKVLDKIKYNLENLKEVNFK